MRRGKYTLEYKKSVIEVLFQHVANKGIYAVDELQAVLMLDQNEIIEGIQELCHLSDLFNFDEASGAFITLKAYQPLDSEKILNHLSADLKDKIIIQQTFVTGSTNSDLEKVVLGGDQAGLLNTLAISVTEMQRGGRGRRAKEWVSPLAKNLYFSLKFHFPQASLPYLSTLSLRSGFALLEALNVLGIDNAKVKWPNDIWVEGQKLAGILVESSVNSKGIDVIIGIGVNNQRDDAVSITGNYPTNCESILGSPLDRNELIAILTEKLYQVCYQIACRPEALPQLSKEWQTHSCFFGKVIRLISDKGEEIGQEVGIDERGALLIQYADGSIKPHLSGDLSLRAY